MSDSGIRKQASRSSKPQLARDATFTVALRRRMALWFGAKIGMQCGNTSRQPATAWRSARCPFAASRLLPAWSYRLTCTCMPLPGCCR
ncbi:hypothetical protein D3C79_1041960 [compost metagenome]